MMKCTWIRVWIVLGVLCVLASSACREESDVNFETGMEAYSQRDYETALEKWRPLAARW